MMTSADMHIRSKKVSYSSVVSVSDKPLVIDLTFRSAFVCHLKAAVYCCVVLT